MKYADISFRYSDSPITLKYFPVPLKYIGNASKMASRHPKQYALKGNMRTFYLQFFYLSTQEMNLCIYVILQILSWIYSFYGFTYLFATFSTRLNRIETE